MMGEQLDSKYLIDAHNSVIAFYNTENFFDTHDNPNKNDDSFLPSFFKGWTQQRYYRKVDNISKVIKNMYGECPILVGLAEIENKWVLKDLINTTHLREANYDFVHYDSADERGIDVCCIYRKDFITILEKKPIEIYFDFDPEDTTRDVLYLKCSLKNNDIFHIFISHWPSRGEGQEKTEPKRIVVANTIRAHIEHIMTEDTNAKIVVMGDFNDCPDNVSVKEYLKASGGDDTDLYNMATTLEHDGKGSYNHRGDWGMFDQMVISKGLRYRTKGYGVKENKMHIFKPEWLLFRHRKFGYLPSKTYTGRKYIGGYSDHLPVYLILD